MYAVRIVSVLLLLVGLFLLTRYKDSALIIPGIVLILIGTVLSRISRTNGRR